MGAQKTGIRAGIRERTGDLLGLDSVHQMAAGAMPAVCARVAYGVMCSGALACLEPCRARGSAHLSQRRSFARPDRAVACSWQLCRGEVWRDSHCSRLTSGVATSPWQRPQVAPPMLRRLADRYRRLSVPWTQHWFGVLQGPRLPAPQGHASIPPKHHTGCHRALNP